MYNTQHIKVTHFLCENSIQAKQDIPAFFQQILIINPLYTRLIKQVILQKIMIQFDSY